MDKRSKIFLLVFFTIIFIVAAIAFYKFYILKDYYIKSVVACDPAIEKCYVAECDSAVDAGCPETAEASYYKLIEKKAKDLPLCDPGEANCPPIACRAGEDCREILCDSATKAKDEQCSDPAEYLKNHQNPGEGIQGKVENGNGQENIGGEDQSQKNFESSN